MAEKTPVPPFANTESDRKDLSSWLCRLVQAGQTAKGGLPQVWQEIGRYYRDEMPDADVVSGEGESVAHVPIMSPRLDTLACDVNTVILDQDPVMLCENLGNEDKSEALENLIHRQWEEGGLARSTRVGTKACNISNCFVYKAEFEINLAAVLPENSDQIELRPVGVIRHAGIKLTGIQAEDFIIGPITLDGVQSAAIVGYRFFQSVKHIKQLQELGVYFEGEEIPGGDDPTPDDRAQAYYYSMIDPSVFTGIEETDLAECYEVYFRKQEDGKGRWRWYVGTVAYRSQIVLKCEEWNYSRPPFFRSKWLPELLGWWSGESTGRKLFTIQGESDRVHSRIYNGTMESSMPPVFAQGIDKENYTEYQPGDIIEQDAGSPPPWSPNINVEFEGLMQIEQNLERAADATIQISTNALGQEESRETTATQTSAIQQGQASRLSEYIANFTEEWPAMANFCCELLYSNWNLWRHMYQGDGDIVQNLVREDLILPKTWRVNGSSPASTPASRRAAIAQIALLAKDPNTMIDMYEVAKAALRYSGIPGAAKFQKDKPIAQPPIQGQPPLQPGQAPIVPGSPGLPPSPVPPQAVGGMQPGPNAIAIGPQEPGIDPSSAGSQEADFRVAGG